jgi:hypothetical protein
MTLEELPKHSQRVRPVLAGGGDVAVQGQERLRPGQGAPAPESFCCSFTILSGAAENPNALPPWAEIVLAKPATATIQTQMPYLTDIFRSTPRPHPSFRVAP